LEQLSLVRVLPGPPPRVGGTAVGSRGGAMAPAGVRLATAGLLGFLLGPQPVAGGAEELTKANFEEKVFGSGKSAFVKFLAPW